jgi:hypothetical protein
VQRLKTREYGNLKKYQDKFKLNIFIDILKLLFAVFIQKKKTILV